jgi:hypothetical protein
VRVDVEQGTRATHGLEGGFEVFRSPHRGRLELQPQGPCCFLHLFPLHWIGWMRGMHEYSYLLEARNARSEELQPLGDSRAGVDRHAGDVAAGVCQALDESDLHRMAQAREDDGNGCRRLLGCHARGRGRNHDDIDLRPNQVVGQLRQLVERSDPEFDDHVLALDVSQLAETFPELVDPEFRRLASPRSPIR